MSETAQQPEKTVDHYYVRIENNSSEPTTAVVFGFNKFWNKENFGSSKGVKITNLQTDGDYSELLSESATNPFQVEEMNIHFEGENEDEKKENAKKWKEKLFDVFHGKATGNSYQAPTLIKDHFDPDLNLIIIRKIFIIRAFSHFKFHLDAHEKIDVHFVITRID